MIKNKDIINLIKKLKRKKKKICLCHGVFDLVHIGHVKHFRSAKKLGDVLIVSITKNEFIQKGPGRPLFHHSLRLEFLKELKVIDYVIESTGSSAQDVIRLIKPDFYIKGPDYENNNNDKTKKIQLEKKLVEKYGGEVIYTKDEVFSSSELINKKGFILSSDQRKFISKIKAKFQYSDLRRFLLQLNRSSVFVVGELIFDKYNFGHVVGKSAKEPHLVMRNEFNELYVGGSGAVARHLSSFAKQTSFLSPFGYEPIFLKTIKINFSKKINYFFFKPYKEFKTIIKNRYIDIVSNYKLFGSYTVPSQEIKSENELLQNTIKNIPFHDLLIASDYGHKFLSANLIKNLKKKTRYICLNAQINSTNINSNYFEKYKNLDCLVVNESEFRFGVRDESRPLKVLAKKIIDQNNYKKIIITQGKNGVQMFDNKGFVHSCPAFAINPIDKVGSGDALFSLCSLALSQKLDPDVCLFFGSIAAMISVESLGNKVSVTFEKLDRIIEYLLK
jgi:rfaE bifunctional protein nucleotidyltransferase chain/domain